MIQFDRIMVCNGRGLKRSLTLPIIVENSCGSKKSRIPCASSAPVTAFNRIVATALTRVTDQSM
ncbi:hypothetical protein [Bradyrhizobium sp.]|jgi:hypothetical protein|uniref:hypothetical protein n=1 Tax=Bradyrhizobium sp. TaxID=376 RepID=UPI003C18A43D